VATSPIYIGPITQPLKLYKGDDFFLDLIITNADGTDKDLSAAVPSAQIRSAPNADDIIASFQAIVDGNVIHLHLVHSEATNLTQATCAWDVQIADRSVPSSFTDTWQWTTSTTQAAAAGQIGLGAGSAWATAATVNVNMLNAAGVDITHYLQQVQGGDLLHVEWADFPTLQFADYTVTADPVQAAPTWWTFPVTLNTSAGAPPLDAGHLVNLRMPTPVISTLAAGVVTVTGEVTMP
jgi:hypothetical protein